MTDTQRLSREDVGILALETGPIAGHVCKVVVVGPDVNGSQLGVDRLRQFVSERVNREPLLSSRLRPSRLPGRRPAWVPDDDFDLSRHVRAAATDGSLDEAGLQALTAALMAQRLDRDHPLWTMDLAPLREGGAAIVWRIHHCLADGAATLRIGANVLWETSHPEVGRKTGRIVPETAPPQGRLRQLPQLPGTLRREIGARSGPSRLSGEVGRQRAVAWADTDLAALHDAAKALVPEATLNDAVLAIVGGALREWLGEDARGLRVKVPVSLHGAGDAASNRDSFLFVDLPLAQSTPGARLAAVARETAERKGAHDAERLDLLLGDVTRLPGGRRALRLVSGPGAFALNVSNVRGPSDAASVAGHPVMAMHAMAEVAPGHALRVAVITAVGRLSFGLCADSDVTPDVDAFAAALRGEIQALERAVA